MAKRGRKRNEQLRADVLELLKAGLATAEIVAKLSTGPKLVRSVARDHASHIPERSSGRPKKLEWRAAIDDGLKSGLTCLQVARQSNIPENYVHRVVREHGGMLPRSSQRSSLRLSLEEREEISRCLTLGWSLRKIAWLLDRQPSTISREVAVNGGRDHYRAWAAERRFYQCARRPKVAKLVINLRLREEVQCRLLKKNSPKQIKLRLMEDFPGQPDMQISHEAIYQSLFIQGRGALRRELTACLRTGRAIRRSQKRETKVGKIKDMVMISERPAEVEDRAVPGHWEGDLIIGKNGSSAIGTLVERHTRYVMLMKLPNKSAATVRDALQKAVARLPEELFRSLTWDQGKEMAEHARFSIETGVPVYFCDPHSPWQRGSNENTNGLLRQYFPKGTALSGFSQDELDAVARELNQRPRETLNIKTPAEVLDQLLR